MQNLNFNTGDRMYYADSIRRFSAPGRVEICGNHTDHQCGRVLAAAIDLEVTADVRSNNSDVVRLQSDIFGVVEIDLSSLNAFEYERGTPAALVRGVAAWYSINGYAIGGFDAAISSDIPIGVGLSSSAAFEVLIGNIFKGLFGACISPIEIARAGQYAESVYFGKPCGSMDQTASSVGGLNMIDFQRRDDPVVTPVQACFAGHSMCVVYTGDSHADLTPDYAACEKEMKDVAMFFGKEYLREVPFEEFHSSIRLLRRLGDRAVLRAIHFYKDNERVIKQAAALNEKDIPAFFDLVIESGRSSVSYLQNAYSPGTPQHQGVTLALAVSEGLLKGSGAWRVHGGGFAGTVLAFVPEGMKEKYRRQMSDVFGEGCCHYLNIRSEGGMELPTGC